VQIDVNNANVYYEQHGSSGPNVLILHGWGCDTTFFAPITAALAEQMRVTIIDFPGHGKSGRPPEPWGVPEYAGMVRNLIGELQLAPCHIIAHSFGGRVALYLSSHWPELIDQMIITGGAGLRKPATPESQKRSREYQRWKKLFSVMERTHVLAKPAEKLAERVRKKYGSADYNALDAEMRQTFVKVINEDLRPLLPCVKASTLLIWGRNDTETPLWMGEVMEREIPDAGLVVFEGGSHFAYLEQWQRFVAVAKHFLIKE